MAKCHANSEQCSGESSCPEFSFSLRVGCRGVPPSRLGFRAVSNPQAGINKLCAANLWNKHYVWILFFARTGEIKLKTLEELIVNICKTFAESNENTWVFATLRRTNIWTNIQKSLRQILKCVTALFTLHWFLEGDIKEAIFEGSRLWETELTWFLCRRFNLQ